MRNSNSNSADDRHEERDDSRPRARSILIIDEADGAELLALGLRRSGYETRVAFDGRSGLFLAVCTSPQIIFLELDLPELSGFEVARNLRRNESTRDIAIYATTGYSAEAFARHPAASAFTGHMRKPLELGAVIQTCAAQTRSGQYRLPFRPDK